MTNTVLLKRSGTANSVPLAVNLALGELALNYTDGNLFYKNASGTVTLLASNQQLSVTGNITAANFLGNGRSLTGITSIANAVSNVNIATANGNVTIGVDSYPGNVAIFDNLGNVTAGHWFVGNGLRIIGDQPGETYSVIITGNAQANLMTMSELFVTDAHVQGTLGNFYGGNLSVVSNIATTGFVQATGNISALGNVIAAANIVGNSSIQVVGNINSSTGSLSVYGNINSGAAISTAGNVTSAGNVAGQYFLGNGAFLTGLTSSGNSISNGTSNVAIPASNGNVQVAVNSLANSVVMGEGSLFVQGPISTPKVINTLALVPNAVNAVMISPLTISASGNIFVPDDSTLTIFTPT